MAPTLLVLLVVRLAEPMLAMGAVHVIAERRWPAGPPRRAHGGLNLAIWLAGLCSLSLGTPALGGLVTLAVNAVGGGLIVLPARGPGLLVGAVVYLVAMDLGEYLFHRAQHAIPVMWSMHALHHSDESFDATTTVRHFWMEPLIKTVTIWLAVGMLFRAPPAIVLIYALASYYNYLIHSNTRLDFGRASWLLNGPAYHRLHHSASSEHFDCNFAALLPIFDVLSGTYRRPKPGERPATGLDTGEAPQTVVQALAWPLRRRLFRGARPPAASPRLETSSAKA